jgi:Protein of unknown function (DUF551)
MSKIEELIREFQFAVNNYSLSSVDKEYIDTTRTALFSEFQRMENELKAYEALTPGGSEFVDDPQKVFAWIKDRLSNAGTVAAERNQLRNELASEREAHRWIPVSERLPEFCCGEASHYVLVVLKMDNSAFVYDKSIQYWKEYGWVYEWVEGAPRTMKDVGYDVIAWQPLPTALVPEGEEK